MNYLMCIHEDNIQLIKLRCIKMAIYFCTFTFVYQIYKQHY